MTEGNSQLTAKDIYGNNHEISINEAVWRPSVYGIIIYEGKLLVLPQRDGGYSLPGGGVDIGEPFEDAVIREVKEETGLDVKVRSFITMSENLFVWQPDTPDEREVYHSILGYYVCDYLGGELSTAGFDRTEQIYSELAQWIPIREALTMPIASTYDFRLLLESVEQSF